MTSDQLVAKETPPHDPIQARPTLPGFKSTDGGLVVVFCDVAHFLTQHLFHERRLDFGEFPNTERPAALTVVIADQTEQRVCCAARRMNKPVRLLARNPN